MTKLEGTHLAPLTDGYICGKVARFPERVYGARRLHHPMVRVGPKGPGARFERVSWDDALDLVASRFRDIAASEGPEAILPYWYGGSNGLITGKGMDTRLWKHLGATRIQRTLCAANAGHAIKAVYGDHPGPDLREVEHADFVILWGCNPNASGIHLVPRLRAIQKRGGTLVVVDPRRIPLAAKADRHVALQPGTDVVLALAMMRVAFDEGLADLAFLEERVEGWRELRDATWDVDEAAAVTGVPAEVIRALSHQYAAASPAMIRCGWGPERNRNGVDATRAILTLPAVFGKFGPRGGGWALSSSGGYRYKSTEAESNARLVNMTELAPLLETLSDPPIRALYVYNCNPAVTVPDQTRLLKQLARDDLFTVVHEQVHTDTCDYADVILPATTFLEHKELTRSYATYAWQWAEPVIAPVGEARSNHAVCRALAARLGLDDPELSHTEEQVAAARVDDFEQLKRDRIRILDVAPSVPPRVTPCNPAPPRYRPLEGGPLALITPAAARAITSTGFEGETHGQVDIHPDDAAARGIGDGDAVEVFNERGVVAVWARVTDRVRPGVLSMPKGLWREASRNGFVSTALCPPTVDAQGGGACYNDARVDVRKDASA